MTLQQVFIVAGVVALVAIGAAWRVVRKWEREAESMHAAMEPERSRYDRDDAA